MRISDWSSDVCSSDLSLVVVLLNLGIIAVYALMINCFCMSIMFPTIFALGLKDLGKDTKKAGSFMIMSIVGGALIPPLMGLLADATDTSKEIGRAHV